MGLDTVELVMAWEQTFSIEMDETNVVQMRTTSEVIDFIYGKVKSPGKEDNGSLTIRAFSRLRKGLRETGYTKKIVLNTKVARFLDGSCKRDQINQVLISSGFEPLGRLPFGIQIVGGRIVDLLTSVVISDHKTLRKPNLGWSRLQIREVVRAVMQLQLDLRGFSDHADIVEDLGVN